jgi:hypothetical protein
VFDSPRARLQNQPGVPAADNEAGWRQALAKLATLVESG